MPEEPIDRFPEGPSNEEIEARLRRIRDELTSSDDYLELGNANMPDLKPLPQIPDDPSFDEKLADLERRAIEAKARREEAESRKSKALKKDAESHRGLGVGLTVAYTIIGMPLLGIGIGWLIDVNQGTQAYRGLGALIGSVLGVIGAVIVLQRHGNMDS